MASTSILSAEQQAFVALARTAILATTAPSGRPRLVPICFVLDGDVVLSPLDEKPKQVEDPRNLARVRDLRAERRVALLVHRWDEDWSQLAWLRLRGTGRLLEPGDPDHAAAIVPLRTKYPQYEAQAIDARPMIRIQLDRATRLGRPRRVALARLDLGEEPEQRLGEPLGLLEAGHVGDVRQLDQACVRRLPGEQPPRS